VHLSINFIVSLLSTRLFIIWLSDGVAGGAEREEVGIPDLSIRSVTSVAQ